MHTVHAYIVHLLFVLDITFILSLDGRKEGKKSAEIPKSEIRNPEENKKTNKTTFQLFNFCSALLRSFVRSFVHWGFVGGFQISGFQISGISDFRDFRFQGFQISGISGFQGFRPFVLSSFRRFRRSSFFRHFFRALFSVTFSVAFSVAFSVHFFRALFSVTNEQRKHDFQFSFFSFQIPFHPIRIVSNFGF